MVLSEALALLAIAISVLSAGYSYRLSREAHRVATYYGAISLFRELDKVFIEYPEARPYFYDGKPLADDDENRERVRAVAEMTLDSFEWLWHRRKRLHMGGESGWEAYIVDTLSNSPALLDHYTSRVRWYPGITCLLRDRPIPPLGRAAADLGGL